MAQEDTLFPHLAVGENVVFGLSRHDRRDAARAETLLESVGLPASYSTSYAAAASTFGLALSPIRWQMAKTRSARFIV